MCFENIPRNSYHTQQGVEYFLLEEKLKQVGWLYSCKTGLCAVKCGIESTSPLCCKEFIFDALLNSCGQLTSQPISDMIVIFLKCLQVRRF